MGELRKIKVFISSICGSRGSKNYNKIREQLKETIDATGIANAYLFEKSGASSLSAEDSYINELEDSDVCIFIIDNEDGVSSGVQKEIDAANKNKIKSIYYFCSEYKEDKTPLESSLRKRDSPKTYTVDKFSDIPKQSIDDLLQEITLIYRLYCRKKLVKPKEDLKDTDFAELKKDSIKIENLNYNNRIFTNTKMCNNFLEKFIFNQEIDQISESSEIDSICAEFLSVLFNSKGVDSFDFEKLLNEIKKHKDEKEFEIISKRYDALKYFYKGNVSSCINTLRETLDLAKKLQCDWLANDISLDLKNQKNIFNFIEGNINDFMESQERINNPDNKVYNPIMDRIESELFEDISNKFIDEKTKSPDTIVIGSNDVLIIHKISSYFIFALLSGSITYLELVFNNLKKVCFYLASKYRDWNILKSLMKLSIASDDYDTTRNIFNYFHDEYIKMDSFDAIEIYKFQESEPILERRLLRYMDAFSITCYYLSDDDFISCWGYLKEHIYNLIDGTLKADLETSIFSMLKNSYFRIPQNDLIEILVKYINRNKYNISKDVFCLIKNLDIDECDKENQDKLFDVIKDMINNNDRIIFKNEFKESLVYLGKKSEKFDKELKNIISNKMPEFYPFYCLDNSYDDNDGVVDVIKELLNSVVEENNTTRCSSITLYFTNKFDTLLKIVNNKGEKITTHLKDRMFKTAYKSIISKNREIDEKLDALRLMSYLIEVDKSIKNRNMIEFNSIIDNKKSIEYANTILSNHSIVNLQLSALFLYKTCGENIIIDLMDILASIGDDTISNRSAAKDFLTYLRACNSIDPQIEQIIIQKSFDWTRSNDNKTIINTIEILLELIKFSKFKKIILSQFVKLVDSSDIYIKSYIISISEEIKKYDQPTYDYIITKAKADTNYVIKKLLLKLKI